MPETSIENKWEYERRMHLERKLAVTRVGVLPDHLYIFMHIKIEQVQVQNSRGHISNVMPLHMLHGGTEPFLTDSHAAYRTPCCSLPGLPKYTQIHLKPHVSTRPWVRFVTDFFFGSAHSKLSITVLESFSQVDAFPVLFRRLCQLLFYIQSRKS